MQTTSMRLIGATSGALLVLLSLPALTGCSGIFDESGETGTQETGESPPTQTLAIAGTYVEDWDGDGSSDSTHVLTDSEWTMTSEFGVSAFLVAQFSNEQAMLIAQNAGSNSYAPDKWSRFDWSLDGATLWFCQSAFEAETEDDALATAAANSDDPASSGCGEFAWSQLTREE